MRSTLFVLLSVTLHALAVTAIAIAPRPVAAPEGHEVEVTVGEPAEQPGLADAPSLEPSQATQPVQAAEPSPPPAPVAPPAAPVAKKVKSVAAKKPVAAAVKEDAPEEMSPELAEEIPVANPEPVASEPETLTPVKDTSPAGVEPTAEPSDEPVSAPEAASLNPAPQETLNKGGATQAGAVSYLDLRQQRGNKAPQYPIAARKEGRQGTVELVYRVTREGSVTDIEVAKSSGFADLDQEAVKAIGKFRFVPGQEGWARHPVAYALKGPAAPLNSGLRTTTARPE